MNNTKTIFVVSGIVFIFSLAILNIIFYSDDSGVDFFLASLSLAASLAYAFYIGDFAGIATGDKASLTNIGIQLLFSITMLASSSVSLFFSLHDKFRFSVALFLLSIFLFSISELLKYFVRQYFRNL
jgi:hypothetical protein